jgi:RNA polymerase sigma-70 factor, ECF subfamily
LPPQQRMAIVLTRVKGLSMTEASQQSGVSVSALKVQVHRGMKRLAALVRKTP